MDCVDGCPKMVEDIAEQFIVIRAYQPGDEIECSKLMHEGAMSTVKCAIFVALTKPVTFQIIITVAAVMYVFVGLPPSVCMTAIPGTLIFIFFCVYVAHLKLAFDSSQETKNITQHFMSSEFTCFWVAEVYEPYCVEKSPSLFKYSLLKESQLDVRLRADRIYSKKIIGTVGVNRCDIIYHSAWLRRLHVSSKYQRKGVGRALLNEAINFCKKKGYNSIELTTTECHVNAIKLYQQNGFWVRQLYHKCIVGTLVKILMYQFSLCIATKTS